MDETTRTADAVQNRFPECVALRTRPGRDSAQVSVRWNRWNRWNEWEGTAFRMCDEYLIALAAGSQHIADIATCWNDRSDAWETSVEMHAVEYAEEREGCDGDEWRVSEGGRLQSATTAVDVPIRLDAAMLRSRTPPARQTARCVTADQLPTSRSRPACGAAQRDPRPR